MFSDNGIPPTTNSKPQIFLPAVHNSGAYGRPITVPYDEAQLRSKLMCFDTNGDGRLSKKELYSAFKSLGSRWAGFRTILALHCADRNADRHISDDEIEVLVKYVRKIGYIVN